MIASTEERNRHVAEWRASGLSAEEFSKPRGFTRERLWAWSSRLRELERKAAGGDDVRLIPVVRRASADDGATVTVHLHDARILVRAGVDRTTLSVVLDAVDGLRRSAQRTPR